MARTGIRCRERGAAAVEFALLAPIVLLIVFAIIQYGLYFWADQGGSDASRDAARLSAVGKPTDCTAFKAAVRAPIDKMGNNFTIVRTYKAPAGTTRTGLGTDIVAVGDTVTVTVTFDSIDLHIPFLPFISNGQVSSSAQARVEYVNDGQPSNC